MPNKKFDGANLSIEIAEHVQQQMEENPAFADALRGVLAKMRQAQQDYHDGKYDSFEEAMAASGAVPFNIDIEE